MRITTYTTALDEGKKNILVKERSINYASEPLNNPFRITEMMCNLFNLDTKAEEYVYMISFNTRSYVLGVFELSHGDVSNSMMNPRELLIRNLLCGATGFVIVHNHPSGNPTPSQTDINVTKKVQAAADLIGIRLLDHIVIGENKSFYSFLEHTLI